MHTYKAHHTRVLASQTHMNDAVPSMITTELLLRCAFVTTGFPLDLRRRCIVDPSEDLFLRQERWEGKFFFGIIISGLSQPRIRFVATDYTLD